MLSFLLVLSSGFESILEAIKAVIVQDFPSIQGDFFIYDTFEDVLEPLETLQRNYDSVFFSDHEIFCYLRPRIRQTTHWICFPRSSDNILRALLEAILQGIDVTRLSIDSYDNKVILQAYREIRIPFDNLYLQICNETDDEDFRNRALAHHLKHLRNKTVNGCFTASTYIAGELRRRNLPYIPVLPTLEAVRRTLSEAMQYHQAQKNALAQIAVIYVNINFPPEYSTMLSDEYSFMLQKMDITKEIYKFADRISASVAEESIYNFILFSTCGPLELETDHFQKFELLSWLQKVTGYSISVGVGNGETAAIARQNAFRAMLKAKRCPNNVAYVILNNEEPLGPFLCNDESQPKDAPTSTTADALAHIAKETGLSTGTLYRLYQWGRKHNTEYFTSKELAEGLKVSKRSADRLLEKLIFTGFAVPVDTHTYGRRGRPARIIRLRLPHPDR